MKVLGWFIVICAALPLVATVAQLMVVVLVALVLLAFVLHPLEVCGTLILLGLLGLVTHYPLLGWLLLLAMVVVALRQQA